MIRIHVIQSFKPDEVTPEQTNQIGLELAEKTAPGSEVAVYTHDDTNHVHNHLVINSVNFETGIKYQAHGKAIRRHLSLDSFKSVMPHLLGNKGIEKILHKHAIL